MIPIATHDGLLQIFDVDHGACALLSMPSGHRVLIDCGHSSDYNGYPWYPGEHLAKCGVKHIDFLIFTNYDEDHASGLPSLIRNGISIGCILGNPTVSPETIRYLKRVNGMGLGIESVAIALETRRDMGIQEVVLNIPGVELSYFWNPWPHWKTENNLSLVVHLSIHGTNFLFPGDMEKDGFNNLLELSSFSALVSKIHVLVAAHHGRESGICAPLFDEHGCKPQLVLISDCEKKYQTQETTPYYISKASGVSNVRGVGNTRYVMTTRKDGEIVIRWESKRGLIY